MNIIKHIQRWNRWRQYYSSGHRLHKLLVLLHLMSSPTFESIFTDEEELTIKEAFIRGFEQGRTQGMIDSQGGKK